MRRTKQHFRRRSEAGYTLMFVVFMVASMWIMATVVTTNLLTNGKRQKEEEMIWRGNQYARAIGLYYRRFSRFPTKVEDLTNQTNGVRFLRKAYKDPMNKEDGSWRFIYVGPSGILIGSNRLTTLQQEAVGGMGTAGGAPLGGLLGQLQGGGQTSGAPGVPLSQQTQDGSSTGGAGSSSLQPQPLGGSTMGGNIIGVGSKIDKPSLKVYLGENNYKNWEFIWNPFGRVLPGQQQGNGAPTPPPAASQQPQDPARNAAPTQ